MPISESGPAAGRSWRHRLGFAGLVGVLACAPSDEPLRAPGPLAALRAQLPFLDAQLAGASTSPAHPRAGGGFAVQGGAVLSPHAPRGSVRAHLGADARDAIEVDAGESAPLKIHRPGARSVAGQIERGVVIYPQALPSADILVTAHAAGVEELVVARDAALELRYEVELPERWRLQALPEPGLAQVLDGEGHARLRIQAQRAWDREGQAAAVSLVVGTTWLSVRVPPSTPTPVVIDPLFVGTSQLLVPRTVHAASQLLDGTVLVTGGSDSLTAELHDPRTGRFTALEAPMRERRSYHTSTLLANGKVLLAGGGLFASAAQRSELYDPASRTFTLNAQGMHKNRLDHTATRLLDGRVLVVGGDQGSSEYSAELYDPWTDRFETPFAQQELRTEHTATLLPDGSVLLFGGRFAFSFPAELFVPGTGEVVPLQVASQLGRSRHSATLLPDGRVLLAGGERVAGPLEVRSDLLLYDPPSRQFQELGAHLLVPRKGHSAIVQRDGRVVFAGGSDGNGPLSSAEWFDPIAQQSGPESPALLVPRLHHTTTLLRDGRTLLAGGDGDAQVTAELVEPGGYQVAFSLLSTPRTGPNATRLLDGRVLVSSGTLGATFADLFDPLTSSFSPSLAPQVATRSNATSTRLEDGRVLLAGGTSQPSASAELYDPTSGRFALTSPLLTPRSYHTATRLPDGRVLVVGGFDASSQHLSQAELYDPPSGAFLPAPPLLKARLFHAAEPLADGRVLVVGGVSDLFSQLASAEVYSADASTVTLAPGALHHARSGLTATRLLDGRVLIAGGQLSTAPSEAELFDPATGTFSLTGAMQRVRTGLTATRLDDGRVLLVGGDLTEEITAELFDPKTGSFSLTAPPTTSPFRHAAELLPDGRVLITGGLLQAKESHLAELFDPKTEQFTPLSLARSLDGARLSETADGSWLTGGPSDAPALQLTGLTWAPQGPALPARRHHTSTLLTDLSLLLVGGEDAQGHAQGAVSQLTPGAAPRARGELQQPRARHTATRLPDGRVLVAGGERDGEPLDTFELLSSASSSVVSTGQLKLPRSRHAAALLPDGRVLLAGGVNAQGDVPINEVFDPRTAQTTGTGEAQLGAQVSHAFQRESSLLLSGASKSARFDAATSGLFDLALPAGSRLSLLATGRTLACQETCRVLGDQSATSGAVGLAALHLDDLLLPLGTSSVALAGTRNDHAWLGRASLLDPGAQPPTLAPLLKQTWLLGETGTATGHGWPVNPSPTPTPTLDDEAVLVWRPLDQAGPVHPVEVLAWREEALDFRLPRTAYHGPGWLYVVTGGVPSEPRLLVLAPALQGSPCSLPAHCASGFCVDGVCCDQACSDGCLACSQAQRGEGLDGECGPVAARRPPRSGCENPASTTCGFTGVCDGTGSCELPGLDTVCNAQGDRCQGGQCKPPPLDTCAPSGTEVLSVTGTRACAPYRCRGGACLQTCASHLDCAPGQRCSSQSRCEAIAPTSLASDPGLLCALSAPGRAAPPWPAALLALLVWRRRRRLAALLGAGVALTLPTRLLAQPSPSGAPSAVPSPPLDPQRERARALLRQGLSLYQAGEVPRALDLFLRSREVLPAKGNVLNAANALRQLGRLDEALELYEEAVAVHSAAFDEDDRVAVPAAMAQLRQQVGSLFVSSTTSGVLVVDGRERARLPLSSPVRLLVGPHTVRVLKDGYRTFEATVSLEAGATSQLDARLEPLASAGGLRVEVPSLPGAEVRVDGVLVGHSPWEGTLAPGQHLIVVRQGDQGSAPTLATVLQGQTALLRLTVSPLGQHVRLTTSPLSARLSLDGVPLGGSSWEGALPLGPHTIRATEEGYFALDDALVSSAHEASTERALALTLDPSHPRWPQRRAGVLRLGASAGLPLGGGFRSDAAHTCAQGRCADQGLLAGGTLGLLATYDLPWPLSLHASLGALSLQQAIHREVPRARGSSPDTRYRIDDLLRLKGYWFAAGAGLRAPLAARWSLRSRLQVGVLLARTSDTATARVLTGDGERPAQLEGSGRELGSAPLFLLSSLDLAHERGPWQLAVGVSAWMFLTDSPALPLGDLRVPPDCPTPRAPGCVADSSQLVGERAHRPFLALGPQLTLTHAF